jgi:hypothetical protein
MSGDLGREQLFEARLRGRRRRRGGGGGGGESRVWESAAEGLELVRQCSNTSTRAFVRRIPAVIVAAAAGRE